MDQASPQSALMLTGVGMILPATPASLHAASQASASCVESNDATTRGSRLCRGIVAALPLRDKLGQGGEGSVHVPLRSEAAKREAAEYYKELFRKVAAAVQESHADLLVMDEIMAAMFYNMVPEQEVLQFLKTRPENLEVVMTGRDPSEAICEVADYITEMKMIRHPYEKGISARMGIEY